MDYYRQKRKYSPAKTRVKQAQYFEVLLPDSPEIVAENEKCVLELKPFAPFPHVSFDRVKVGTSKTCILYIYNPLEVSQTIYIEKFPSEKGFSINLTQICVPPFQEVALEISWNPVKSISCRETVSFKTSSGCRAQAYLHGISFSPKKEKKRKTWQCQKSPGKVISKNYAKNKAIVANSIKEDKKENVDFLNSKVETFIKEPTSSEQIFKFDNDCAFPSSPIRRQTYTINSMFKKDGRKSVLLNLPSSNNTINKCKETFNLSDVNSVPLKEFEIKSKFPELEKEDELNFTNDSLEESVLEENYAVRGSTIEPQQNTSSETYTDNSLSDGVKIFNPAHKDVYFCSMPTNPCLINSEDIKSESICDVTIDKMPMCTSFNFNINSFQSASNTCVIKSVADELLEAGYLNKVIDTTLSSSMHDCLDINTSPKAILNTNSCTVLDETKSINYNNLNSFQTCSKQTTFYKQKSMNEKSDFHDANGLCIEVNHEFVEPIMYFHLEDSNLCLPDQRSDSLSIISPKSSSICVNEPPLPYEIPFSSQSGSKEKLLKKKPYINQSKKSVRRSPKLRSSRINTRPNMRGNEPSIKIKNKIPDAKQLRGLPRRLVLKKEKLLEKLCQKNPFASVNIYYDEFWMQKQETAFTNWLNFILTPNDDFISSEEVQVNYTEVWITSIKDSVSIPAPSKEDLSFRTYTAASQLNRLRKSAFSLYQSESLGKVIKKIEKEVDLKKIIVRKDRAIHADLGIKKDIMEMLLSYNPLWLRIGLETTYGEIIRLRNNQDILGLSNFIIYRFFSNPDIVVKYTNPTVPNYHKPGFDDEMRRFMLKKFLLLVYFLDVAKNAHLIEYNPCLFCKTSKYKCSRDLLLNFSREYLSGEGDVTKHLRYLGCVVTYQQSPIEEFDYAVRNISKDLRCGLRLGRVVELLLQDWSISKSLRVNTINRLNKIHNNDVILKALKNASIEIEDNIDPRDIVDGNREKTLSLLWQIIFKTQISKQLKREILLKENVYLSCHLQLKADCAAFSALREANKSEDFEAAVPNSKLYEENEIIQLLLQWCQNVCAHYKLKIHNFTSSFTDGRALCYLLHHYHPNVLPFEKIKQETSCSYIAKKIECDESESPFFSENDKLSILTMEELLRNEKNNWDLVFKKLQEIGQVPILAFPPNVTNRLPDEKVIITLVSYINIRLMELSIEIRAARTIQLAYRKWKLRKKQEKLKVEIAAIIVIQKAWRNYRLLKKRQEECKAATSIQCTWRMYLAKKTLNHLKQAKHLNFLKSKATAIQAFYRGYIVRKYFGKCMEAVLIIQRNVRRYLCRKHFLKVKNLVIKIQRTFRAKVLGNSQRQDYLKLKNIVSQLQRRIREKQLRMNSAVKIQTNVRRYLLRKKYLLLKSSTVKIQLWWKAQHLGQKTRTSYLHYKKNIVLLQSLSRKVIAQKAYKKQKHSVILIQKNIRKMFLRKKYCLMKSSAIVIQTWWRAELLRQNACSEYQITRTRIILLQSLIRSFITRRAFHKKKMAAVVIQKNVRKMLIQKKYFNIKSSAELIQSHWRAKILGKQARLSYIITSNRIVLLQSLVKQLITQRHYKKKRFAAIVIQKHVRKFLAVRKFNQLKSKVLIIQRWFKARLLGMETRASYLVLRKKIVFSQSLVRGFIARKAFNKQKLSVIIIQKYMRKFIARRFFCTLRANAIKIQKWWKNLLISRLLRKEYLLCQKAAVKIQSTFRMYCSRKNFKKLKNAVRLVELYQFGKNQRTVFLSIKKNVIKIQAFYRSFRCRKLFLLQKSAVITLQSSFKTYKARKCFSNIKLSAIKIQHRYRLYREMCTTRNNYLKMKKGFTRLQAVKRGNKVRKEIENFNKKATIIQSVYRMRIAKCHYQKLKRSCVVIQRKYHAQKLMKRQLVNYRNLKDATIIIQKYVRSYIISKQYNKMKLAVIKIQAFIRMVFARQRYFAVLQAVIHIQRAYRSKCLMNQQRLSYIKKRKMVIFLQAKVRTYLARKKFLKIKNACILIQSLYRMWIKRRAYQKLYNATITIQKHFRSYRAGIKVRSQFLCTRNACIKIQSFARMIRKRKQYKITKESILKLQFRYRALCSARKERQKFLQIKKNCIYIQCYMRMAFCRNKYFEMRKSCIIIQSYFRMHVAHKNFLKIKKSVIVLQKYLTAWRDCRREHAKYLKLKKSATLIQSVFRGNISRKNLEIKRKACIKIQSKYRSYICYKQFQIQKQATLVLQQYIRASLKRKLEQKSYIEKRNRIIKLQAVVRGWLARKYYKRLIISVVKIQATYKSYICRKDYIKKRNSVLVIQNYFRAYLSARRIHLKFKILRNSAIVIQSLWRGIKVRRKFFKQKQAAIILQSYFRRMLLRKRFLKIRSSAVIIQRHYLAYKVGSQKLQLYQRQRENCIKIQHYWRKYLVSKRRKEKMNAAAIVLQRHFKKWKQYQTVLELNNSNGFTSHQQHMWYMKLRGTIIKFQHHARLYIAKREHSAILIQSYYRMWLAQKHFKKEKSALRIQAVWRGYAIRRCITGEQILSIRKKIKNTVSNEYHWLRSRTIRSLAILLKSRNINCILSAVHDLEVCTRMSPTCCERLGESKGLSVLVNLIRSCNRSEPHKEIILYCTNILLNVAKHKKTVNSVWEQENILETIVELMRSYKDKAIPIFSKCCSLLWIFCQDSSKVRLLKDCEEFSVQIKNLHNSVMRKHKIAEKSAKFGNTTWKGNSLLDSRTSLQIDPDWLLGKHRRREFKDSVNAISSLMQLLELTSDYPTNKKLILPFCT